MRVRENRRRGLRASVAELQELFALLRQPRGARPAAARSIPARVTVPGAQSSRRRFELGVKPEGIHRPAIHPVRAIRSGSARIQQNAAPISIGACAPSTGALQFIWTRRASRSVALSGSPRPLTDGLS